MEEHLNGKSIIAQTRSHSTQTPRESAYPSVNPPRNTHAPRTKIKGAPFRSRANASKTQPAARATSRERDTEQAGERKRERKTSHGGAMNEERLPPQDPAPVHLSITAASASSSGSRSTLFHARPRGACSAIFFSCISAF